MHTETRPITATDWQKIHREIECLGEPDIKVQPLRIWIHGRQFPEAEDYWDGNFLRLTAYCITAYSAVRLDGAFLHLRDIVSFLEELKALNESLEGIANMECLEPWLKIRMSAMSRGYIDSTVEIKPELGDESHSFSSSFDQTFLSDILRDCRAVLEQYHVRDPDKMQL